MDENKKMADGNERKNLVVAARKKFPMLKETLFVRDLALGDILTCH